MKNIIYIKNIKSQSVHYSLGIKLLGKTILVSHKTYNRIGAIALFAITMFAPVGAIAFQQL